MRSLKALVGEELDRPVDPRISAMAQAIALRHGQASRAVLFYGSCLRQGQLEGLMLDFYLIVASYRQAYDKRWLAAANRLIPPNVFYFEHGGLVAKYAVLSEADFAHECGPRAWTVSAAARFAQPSRLVWSADSSARQRAIDTVSEASVTLISWTLPAAGADVLSELWKDAFARTFRAELRAERSDRSASIVEADPDRYDAVGRAVLQEIAERQAVSELAQIQPHMSRGQMRRWWRRKQVKGKFYSIARLAKASMTFAGGADYIAWKINRHAGTDIQLKPWQRRWPLLAAITLLPTLLRSGAVR